MACFIVCMLFVVIVVVVVFDRDTKNYFELSTELKKIN